MAALGRGGASAVLRGAHERPGVVHLPFPGWAALVPRVAASSPDRSHHLGADGAARSALAASSTHLPSVSLEATWRCHLRQEPSAVIPLAGICGGGCEQSQSLLRLYWGDSTPAFSSHLRGTPSGDRGPADIFSADAPALTSPRFCGPLGRHPRGAADTRRAPTHKVVKREIGAIWAQPAARSVTSES